VLVFAPIDSAVISFMRGYRARGVNWNGLYWKILIDLFSTFVNMLKLEIDPITLIGDGVNPIREINKGGRKDDIQSY